MKKKIDKVLLKVLNDLLPKVVIGVVGCAFYLFLGTCIGTSVSAMEDLIWGIGKFWSIGKCGIVGNIILSGVMFIWFGLMKLEEWAKANA